MHSRALKSLQHPQRGLSLIELMVAVTLGMILVGVLASSFVAVSRSYRQDDKLLRVEEELRFAMAQISADIEMTGYWSSLFRPTLIELDASLDIRGSDCGPAAGGSGPAALWSFTSLDRPLFAADNATTSSLTDFPCISNSDLRSGTDIISIKRVRGIAAQTIPSGQPDSRTGMSEYHVYLQTNGTRGILFLQPQISGGSATNNPAISPSITAPMEYWEYSPVVYFIRRNTEGSDGVPALCRKQLTVESNKPAYESQCLATGIEDLQLEYGIDKVGVGAAATSGDGVPEYYVTNPSPAELDYVSAVRVLLVARSREQQPDYTNAKTYSVSNSTVGTPNDHYYRRVLSRVVLVRNPAALRQANQ